MKIVKTPRGGVRELRGVSFEVARVTFRRCHELLCHSRSFIAREDVPLYKNSFRNVGTDTRR